MRRLVQKLLQSGMHQQRFFTVFRCYEDLENLIHANKKSGKDRILSSMENERDSVSDLAKDFEENGNLVFKSVLPFLPGVGVSIDNITHKRYLRSMSASILTQFQELTLKGRPCIRPIGYFLESLYESNQIIRESYTHYSEGDPSATMTERIYQSLQDDWYSGGRVFCFYGASAKTASLCQTVRSLNDMRHTSGHDYVVIPLLVHPGMNSLGIVSRLAWKIRKAFQLEDSFEEASLSLRNSVKSQWLSQSLFEALESLWEYVISC